MKKVAASCVLILTMVTAIATARVTKDDLLPWPWGSECPFPWAKIEGQWEVRDHVLNHRFVFQIHGVWADGTRVLEVRRYDGSGAMIGQGQGLSPKDERIVRAAMTGVGPADGQSYWAFIRTYTEKAKASCSRSKQVTVLTLRSTNDTHLESHFILDKVDDNTRATSP